MIRAAFSILFAALAWPALRWRTPARCPEGSSVHGLLARGIQEVRGKVARRLRVLAERHRKDEQNLHRLMTKAQQAWLVWREAACRVDTYESIGGSGFSVYWDGCRIKMIEARAIERST
jgi:hypothetical protein